MRTHRSFLTVILLALLVGTAGCGAVTPAPSLTKECRTIVDGLYQIKKDLNLPDHFNDGEPFRQATDFDPNQYFQILTNIKLQSDYKLDYVYFSDDLGGKPLIYARKSSEMPFQTYEDLLKSFGEKMSRERSYAQLNHTYDYLDKIQIDKTPASYFQFVVLALLGNQYYLSWHGLYDDTIILCDSSDIKYVTADVESLDKELPQDIVNQAQNINFIPEVTREGNTVTVRFVTFTKWGGFYENVYKLDNEKDVLKLLDAQWNSLIEYDCGIAF